MTGWQWLLVVGGAATAGYLAYLFADWCDRP